MKRNVYKVVIMEDVKTSSIVWTQFIEADSDQDIKKYVANSDCKVLYLEKLDGVDALYTDKPIDVLANGVMNYNRNDLVEE